MKKLFNPMQKIVMYGLLNLFLIHASCTKEPQQELASQVKDQAATVNVLELRYEVEATTRYLFDINEEFSDLDIASMTPLRSKSSVKMRVDTRGQVYMEIVDIPVAQPVEIIHKTLPDDSPKIRKTVISEGVATFFTDDNRELSTATIEIPNQLNLVQRITESRNCISQEDIDYVLATMQGQMFAENLEEFIANEQSRGTTIEELNEQYITMRIPLSRVDANNMNETVLLMDRINNRFIGSAIYSETGEELLTTMFGYGPPEEPYLRAIKQKSKERLPSGKGVAMETVTLIENLNLKINI